MAISKYLDPKNDIAFKKIFGAEKHKDILIHFLNDILGFFENDKILDIEFLCPNLSPDITSQKLSIVDVLCKDENGAKYIIEMQVVKHKGFEKRAQHYAAKTYAAQVGIGEKYHNLKEVIFIGIANCVIFPKKSGYKSHHLTLDKKTQENDLKDLQYTFIELPKFTKSKEELSSIEDKWCYFFKHAHETTEVDLHKIIGNDKIILKAYSVLDQYNWTEQELSSYEAMIKLDMDKAAARDQELDDAEAKGREEGVEKTARNLLKVGCEIGMIAEATGLSKEHIENLRIKHVQ